MKDEIAIKKNVLDLEHSEKLADGIAKLGLALTGSITILTSLGDNDKTAAFVLALVFFAAFWVSGWRCLEHCKKIRENVKKL